MLLSTVLIRNYLNVVIGGLSVPVDYTDGTDFLFWGELTVIKTRCGVIDGVNVGPSYRECLSLVGKAEVTLLILVVYI